MKFVNWRKIKMNNKEEKNICKKCKHFRSLISSDVVFTERVEICDKLSIEWPFEIKCENDENEEEMKLNENIIY